MVRAALHACKTEKEKEKGRRVRTNYSFDGLIEIHETPMGSGQRSRRNIPSSGTMTKMPTRRGRGSCGETRATLFHQDFVCTWTCIISSFKIKHYSGNQGIYRSLFQIGQK